MGFHVGDKVIHWTYGLGEIVHIEEKTIHGSTANCYVVRTPDMTIWIPINEVDQHSLRVPTPPKEFERLSAILTRPGEKNVGRPDAAQEPAHGAVERWPSGIHLPCGA